MAAALKKNGLICLIYLHALIPRCYGNFSSLTAGGSGAVAATAGFRTLEGEPIGDVKNRARLPVRTDAWELEGAWAVC